MAAPVPAVPILGTKLYIPPPPPKVVVRARLLERLDEGLAAGAKLTLISAPAGFGKSTLVSEWLASGSRPGAWLSLDENDNDPVRFLIYLIRALQNILPEVGAGLLSILQSPQPPPVEPVLITLLNEITTIPEDFILVLDDYHVIDTKSIDQALNFLVEHLPPPMHLVITTREDPVLPIPRMRVRGQVTELRAADLRFTPSEATEFLNQVMGLPLSAEEVAVLETRTEGWIAGLQLAALSLKGHQDITGFIQAFAGDHRYIVDYLVEEVLQRQPESVRNFLLQTAILERLSGPLCDAVIGNHPEGTGQPVGKARLESLQRGNFFLVPLDDRRHWYRYHHLFADVLRMHLTTEQPDLVPVLHRRASEWYEQNGSTPDAIYHALTAQDFDRAADLMERALPTMRQSRQESTLLGWLKALPEELFRRRPVLSVHYAGTLLQNGQLDGVESRLRDAERWLEMPADLPERPLFVDEEDFQHLPVLIAMYHAAIALARADVANAVNYAREVLALAGEEDYFLRGAASSLLGLASWTSGDLETGYRIYSEGMAHLQRVGFLSDVIGGCVTLADIRITQGRLREAMGIYERGLQLATTQGGHVLRGAADMHVGMSELYRERNELDTAEEHLLKSKELGDLNGLPKNPSRWRVAMARIRQARGDLAGAVELLDEAERLYNGDFSPNVRPIPALRARVWIAQGEWEKALLWAREQGLSAGDELSYLREFEHITLARLLSRRPGRSMEAATGLLDRLATAAEAGGRIGHLIEILVLQALARQRQGDVPAALVPLERALTLAAPEGYARIFLDEGAEMAKLLRAAARGILPGYAGRLLDAWEPVQQGQHDPSRPPSRSTSQPLAEPLTERELEILRLFRTELSGPEIARELTVALSTVRTHTKSIYSKLKVNSRRAAVRRAEELGLI